VQEKCEDPHISNFLQRIANPAFDKPADKVISARASPVPTSENEFFKSLNPLLSIKTGVGG
jgi:hypothetical protein